MNRFLLVCLVSLVGVSACSRLEEVGRAPDFTPERAGAEYRAMTSLPLPVEITPARRVDSASLWSGARGSLLGDRRAMQQGDIMTVVIEINDKAEISNSTNRSRSGSEDLNIAEFLSIPERINPILPAGATVENPLSTSSSSKSAGDGSVKRNEKLTLRVAATITGVLPNGVLQIAGRQEVRVNFEMRELLVTGYVRPEDISRQNEITYDKIASARISYGGRGQISDMQQPRYGQQIADILLPF